MIEFKSELYDKFHCIGSDCPFTCCGGWKITVDQGTEAKYENLSGELGEVIRANLEYDKGVKGTVIKLDKKGMCPMCDGRQLCRIVSELGEEMICDTCKVFPRSNYKLILEETKEIFYYKHVDLACPYMVHLVKNLDHKIDAISVDGNEVVLDGNKDQLLISGLEIRDIVMQIIHADKYPLWFREFFGAYILEKLKSDYLNEKIDCMYEKLWNLLDVEYMDRLYDGVKNMTFNPEQRFQTFCGFWNELIPYVSSRTIQDKDRSDLLLKDLINTNVHCTYDEWKSALKKWKERRNDLCEENLFVYQWFQSSLSSSDGFMLLDNYYFVVYFMSVIRHLEILYLIKHDELEDSVEETIIAAVHRGAAHLLGKFTVVAKAQELSLLSPSFIRCLADL